MAATISWFVPAAFCHLPPKPRRFRILNGLLYFFPEYKPSDAIHRGFWMIGGTVNKSFIASVLAAAATHVYGTKFIEC